jgi:hypothetical protein
MVTLLGSLRPSLSCTASRVTAVTFHPEVAARYGCPAGSLSSELGNAKTQPQERAHSCYSSRSAGSKQLNELGRPDARELAITLMSSYEGAAP